MVIGMISWVISVVLSIPITVVLTVGAGLQFFSNPMPVVYGLDGIFIWLFGTLLIAALASALPARRASRLTVRDTLAYE
jgi:putative ABC transport system permease protein